MKNFLHNSEHTGRHIITDLKTGRKFYVEPIGYTKTDWGDIDPATKKVTGSYGKYQGSISKEESLITEENGFTNIHEFKGSPQEFIRQLCNS